MLEGLNMILTDKAKDDFLTWMYSEYDFSEKQFNEIYPTNLKESLIIEWFDSVGIYICIDSHYKNFGYKIQDKGNVVLYDHMFAIQSRQEATKQAILTANKLYNELPRQS